MPGFFGNTRWSRGEINPNTDLPHKGCAFEALTDVDAGTAGDYTGCYFDSMGLLFKYEEELGGVHKRWNRGEVNPDTTDPHQGLEFSILSVNAAYDSSEVTYTFSFDSDGRLNYWESYGLIATVATTLRWNRGEVNPDTSLPHKGITSTSDVSLVFTDTHENVLTLKFHSEGMLDYLETYREMEFKVSLDLSATDLTGGGSPCNPLGWILSRLPGQAPGGATWTAFTGQSYPTDQYNITAAFTNARDMLLFYDWVSGIPNEVDRSINYASIVIAGLVTNTGTTNITVNGTEVAPSGTFAFTAMVRGDTVYDNPATYVVDGDGDPSNGWTTLEVRNAEDVP